MVLSKNSLNDKTRFETHIDLKKIERQKNRATIFNYLSGSNDRDNRYFCLASQTSRTDEHWN